MGAAFAALFALAAFDSAAPRALAPAGATGGSYTFNECERPRPPEFAADAARDGRKAVQAHNEAVTRFNAHVGAVNAYFACLSDEADRDLRAYYQAVSATLDAEQDAVLGEIEVLRAKLRPPRR